MSDLNNPYRNRDDPANDDPLDPSRRSRSPARSRSDKDLARNQKTLQAEREPSPTSDPESAQAPSDGSQEVLITTERSSQNSEASTASQLSSSSDVTASIPEQIASLQDNVATELREKAFTDPDGRNRDVFHSNLRTEVGFRLLEGDTLVASLSSAGKQKPSGKAPLCYCMIDDEYFLIHWFGEGYIHKRPPPEGVEEQIDSGE